MGAVPPCCYDARTSMQHAARAMRGATRRRVRHGVALSWREVRRKEPWRRHDAVGFTHAFFPRLITYILLLRSFFFSADTTIEAYSGVKIFRVCRPAVTYRRYAISCCLWQQIAYARPPISVRLLSFSPCHAALAVFLKLKRTAIEPAPASLFTVFR